MEGVGGRMVRTPTRAPCLAKETEERLVGNKKRSGFGFLFSLSRSLTIAARGRPQPTNHLSEREAQLCPLSQTHRWLTSSATHRGEQRPLLLRDCPRLLGLRGRTFRLRVSLISAWRLEEKCIQHIWPRSGVFLSTHCPQSEFYFVFCVVHFAPADLWHLTSLPAAWPAAAADRASSTRCAPKSSPKSKNSRGPGFSTPPGGHNAQTADLFNWHLRSWPKVQINSEVTATFLHRNANRLYPSGGSRTWPDPQLSPLDSLLGEVAQHCSTHKYANREDLMFPIPQKNHFWRLTRCTGNENE